MPFLLILVIFLYPRQQ